MPTANGEQERHQDYVFDAPTLIAGQVAAGISFQLDADWPFELRGLAARVPYVALPGPALGTQNGLQFISARWAGPNTQDYKQQDFVPLPLLLGPYFGQLGNPKPVFPPVRWPRKGIITIDLRNDGAAIVTGLQLFFRGVKVGPQGAFGANYTYPAKMSRPPLPFWYPLTVSSLGVNDPARISVPFAPENDSDFVFRFGQAGPQTGTYEVFITLKDEAMKPYSNAPVHADVLFGRSTFPAVFPVGTSFVAPVGPGASQPGLLVPEIYIPRTHKMWFDIERNDLAYAGAAAVDYPLTFGGMKVF